MTFTLQSPQKIAQVVPGNVMNNINEHEIIVEHKNFFAPLEQGFTIFVWPCTLSAFRQMNMYP